MAGRPVDPQRFPALADYLSKLPAGLASYPEATTMGILLKSAVSQQYFHPSWRDLPQPLVDGLRRPPLPTTWVPAVLTDAVFCVICDTFYPTPEAVEAWTYERTIRLASVPMYRGLTRFAGIERFLAAAARVHAFFQRGTHLAVRSAPGAAEVELTHPPHLHGRLNHLSNQGAFRAALEAAGGQEVSVLLESSTPTRALYRARWRTGHQVA